MRAIRGSAIPEAAFWLLGYAVFGIAILNLIGVGHVGPDMLTAAFCCLAGWGTLRFPRSAPSIGRALLLGVVLALGYYAKAPLFPLGFIFLLCACLGRPLLRRAVFLDGMALATFLLICAPFIIALSHAKGRLTFGDAARISQALYINGVHYQHWRGGPPGSGMPVHPTRKVSDHPEIYEFAAKDMGTYPASFDTTYWYEGVTPHLNFKVQGKVLVYNLIQESQIIVESGAELVCAAIILALLCGYRRWAGGFAQLWFIWTPGVIALVMFALVHIEIRFLGGWLILLLGGAVCAFLVSHGYRHSAGRFGVFAFNLGHGNGFDNSTGDREAVGSDHAAGRAPSTFQSQSFC